MEDILKTTSLLNLNFLLFHPNLIPSLGCLPVNVTTIHPSFRLGSGTHPPLLPFSHSPSHPHMHACSQSLSLETSYLLNISWICPLLSIPVASTSIHIFTSLFLDYKRILVSPPPALPFSRFLLHAIAGELFLNYPFDHESLSTSQCCWLHTGQKQTPGHICLFTLWFLSTPLLILHLDLPADNWLPSSQVYLSSLEDFYHMSLFKAFPRTGCYWRQLYLHYQHVPWCRAYGKKSRLVTEWI